MQLPVILKEAIEDEISQVKPDALKQAAAELSSHYRTTSDFRAAPITTEAHRIAYLATRMPATFVSLHAVFAEIKNRLPEIQLDSLLDCGAGAGTAMWAACQVFDDIEAVTNIERDRNLVEIGKRLAQKSAFPAIATARWVASDLQHDFELTPHDLVVLSYSFGELREATKTKLLQKVWQMAEKLVVLIEPGTPRGFRNVLAARSALIHLGAHILAPCPHALDCPMTETDWCHFSARVERAAFHRRAKDAALGYEDEKYAYLVAAKIDCEAANARIIRHPFIQKGHIRLELCTKEGLQQVTVSKKNKAAFRQARKSSWGDVWG
jgi:ribosomal protein RSM22 (predicted rRNA methylase)